MKYIFNCHVIALTGSRTPPPSDVQIRLNARGLPRTNGLLSLLKGKWRDPVRIRLVLSLLKSYDLVYGHVDYSIESIVEDIDRPIDLS